MFQPSQGVSAKAKLKVQNEIECSTQACDVHADTGGKISGKQELALSGSKPKCCS